MDLHPFETSILLDKQYLGGSEQAKYISRYLSEIGASAFVVEERYIDKDYMIDYSKFYSRSDEVFEKHTKRLHFFKDSFQNNSIIKSVESLIYYCT